MANILHIHDTPQAVAEGFAAFAAEQMRGRQELFSIALSGGSTPQLLFRHLAEQYRDRLNWGQLQLFWGDERCVPYESEESNYGNAHRLLLQHVPVRGGQVHPIECTGNAEMVASQYGQEMIDHVPNENGYPLFDLVLLGMGEDGHTASIFPNRMDLLEAQGPVVAVQHPETGQARISLTLPVINRADMVVFLVTGSGKAGRVADIIRKRGNYRQYPAAHVEPMSGQLHWFLDREAAAGLTEVI